MRDYAEEASQLSAVAQYLERFDVLITYNGRSYDQPLLETRFRMCRARHPFDRLPHLDLLYGARRLWKRRMENCKLTHLEREVLGVEREGDVPGSLIPYLYFEFVKTKRAARLIPVFHHNVLDIVSLACLTAIVPGSFSQSGNGARAARVRSVGAGALAGAGGKTGAGAAVAGTRDDGGASG